MHARISAFLVVLALVVTGVAGAQETTGTISGRIVDAQGLAVPGATVTVTGPQGARTIVTDAGGRFSMPLLTPGVYVVRAELQGFKALQQQNVNVSLGQTVDLDLRMEVGGLTETVEVAATAPVVDTQTSGVTSTIDSAMLSRLPMGRRFTDTLYMAPGVSNSGQVGEANPSIGGGTGLENNYIVDGVNITNTGYGAVGSYSIVFGSLGTGLPYDFMKEVQVKTYGFEAEYGASTGGVVNVVTKSGTNQLAGSAFGYFQPNQLEADWRQITLTNGAVNTTGASNHDIGFQIGGPAVRDKLFWIGAINPVWETRSYIAPEGFPLRSLGEVDRERQITNYSAKATFQANSNHRIEASFYGDPAKGEMGPQRSNTALRGQNTAAFSEIEYGGHQQVGKYDGIFGARWLLEASVARSQNKISETPSVNEWSVRDRRVTPNTFSGGIGFFEVGNDGENLQYSVKSTNIFGAHQVRYGFTYEDIQYSNIIDRTGPAITLRDGRQTVTGAQVEIFPDPTFGQIYRVVRANLSNVRVTEQQYPSFFGQATLRFGDRLTVMPGVRYDQQKLVGNLTDFQWDGNWAPRVGVTFDPTGNGRAKVYGNWGRFYAKIPNDLAARALSADAGITRADYFDAALTRPVPDGVLAAGQTTHLSIAGQFAADIDPDSKSTYSDEAILGFEAEAFNGVNLGIRYVHRNMPRVLEDIGTAPMVAYFLGGLSGVEYFITNPGPDSPVTDVPPGYAGRITFEDPIHDYDAVELTAEKRFSDNWSLLGSYRWSRLYGTFEGFFRNDNGQSDPAITSLFDFPTNDPSYVELGRAFGFRGDIRYLGEAGAGPLPNDRPHQFKLFGNRTFTNLNLGVALNFTSGKPLTAMAANPDYQSDGEIPETPRGAGIDTVDGFLERTPFETDFDVHADYAVRFGDRRVVLLADVFNLFNLDRIRDYDQNTETTFQALNPDFGRVSDPNFQNRFAVQSPFRLRVGVRYEF